MIVLAIDTSTPRGSVALVDVRDDGSSLVLAEEEFSSQRSHNALIFAPLGRLLERPEKPAMVVVGTGPGSYTGIRIGIAAAHGIALALGIPWLGHNSLGGLSDAPHYHVFGDARRGGVFHAVVDHGRLSGDPTIHPVEELEHLLKSADAPVFTTDAHPLHPALVPSAPSAARLAVLGAGIGSTQDPIEPLYLRAPYITVPKK